MPLEPQEVVVMMGLTMTLPRENLEINHPPGMPLPHQEVPHLAEMEDLRDLRVPRVEEEMEVETEETMVTVERKRKAQMPKLRKAEAEPLADLAVDLIRSVAIVA